MSRHALKVTIAGGGIAGLATAFALADRGAKVRLYSPAGPPSASAVAAGMIAPALEALFDPLSADRFGLMRSAAERWPDFLDRAGLDGVYTRSGALLAAGADEPPALDVLGGRLTAMGARVERLGEAAMADAFPALSRRMGAGLFIPDEARVAPEPLLEALRAILAARGVELIDQRLLQPNEVLQDADRLVVAVGAGGGDLRALAPELAVLEPVRGQILAFRAGAGPAGGPTLRNIAGGYLAPQAGGALAGGTMEPGRSDLAPDPATAERLRGQAAALVPALASASATSRVGIRASTPDGLPLVGASATARVLLAAGMRRNGWLLAPLVAEIIAAQVLGEPAPTEAALFEPGRFEA